MSLTTPDSSTTKAPLREPLFIIVDVSCGKHILLSLIGPIQVLLFFRLAEEPVADSLNLVGVVEGVHVLAPFAVGREYGA